MSTLRAPSKRKEAVREEMICAKRRFKFVYVGRSMSRLRRQLSYMMVTSVCSKEEWTQRTVLYGSTTAVAT